MLLLLLMMMMMMMTVIIRVGGKSLGLSLKNVGADVEI
jgi:hypothetical protein